MKQCVLFFMVSISIPISSTIDTTNPPYASFTTATIGTCGELSLTLTPQFLEDYAGFNLLIIGAHYVPGVTDRITDSEHRWNTRIKGFYVLSPEHPSAHFAFGNPRAGKMHTSKGEWRIFAVAVPKGTAAFPHTAGTLLDPHEVVSIQTLHTKRPCFMIKEPIAPLNLEQDALLSSSQKKALFATIGIAAGAAALAGGTATYLASRRHQEITNRASKDQEEIEHAQQEELRERRGMLSTKLRRLGEQIAQNPPNVEALRMQRNEVAAQHDAVIAALEGE